MNMNGIKSTFLNRKSKKIAGDLLYSIGAIALMNIVLQFVAYPLVNRTLGTVDFGNMLFWAGVISVLAPSFGLAVNNTRLVFPEREQTQNGDYNVILIFFSIVSFLVLSVIGKLEGYGGIQIIILGYILLFSIFRNYSTVEYRLSLNYRRQFVFYGILSFGYAIGALACLWSKSWFGVYIFGESFAVLYVIWKGSIYKLPFKRSEYSVEIRKRCITLAGAYLLTNLMMNLDRFVLKYFVGEEAVSQYYVLSLIGKTIAIIGGPLSSIIIGYISKDQYRLNRKQFRKIIVLMFLGGVVFWVAASVATPVFVYIFYPNLIQSSIILNIIINGAQILYFLTNLLLVIVLTLCSEKWQFIIQISYTLFFVFLSISGTMWNGIWGFSIAAFISNLFYIVLTIAIGIYYAKGT